MPMRSAFKYIACAFFSSFIPASFAQTSDYVVGSHQKAFITGAELKAGAVIYAEFSRNLAKRKKDSDLGSFLGLIENYDVIIKENDDSYLFHIKPKHFHGRLLNGGSVDYVIQKSDYKIKIVNFSK